MDSSADESLYNWKNRASAFAVGAAVENMRIAASGQGLAAEITSFPDPLDDSLVARVRLTKINRSPHMLESAIQIRATNRKPFETRPLPPDTLDQLAKAAEHIEGARICFTADRGNVRVLAEAGAVNERIMLSNAEMHHFFFSHVNWSKYDDDKKRTGFFIDTLELPPPARIGFKVMRSWARASFLNRWLKFNDIVAKQNAAGYTKAAAFGAISMPVESARSAFDAGRAFESLWLTAAHMGLSLQPLMGTIFLRFAARAQGAGLSISERDLIIKKNAEIQGIFDIKNSTTYALFRIGKGAPPTARSTRKRLEDVLIPMV